MATTQAYKPNSVLFRIIAIKHNNSRCTVTFSARCMKLDTCAHFPFLIR